MKRETASVGSSWEPMLRAVPMRNTAARAVENQENGVTVYVKQKRPGFMVPPLSWIVPFRPERSVTLDGIGARVWRWCDGTRTVEEVIDLFRGTYSLTFHEARAAVTGYLRMLIKRGILAVAIQEEP